jgi:deoxycytidine triphosphate deaminase
MSILPKQAIEQLIEDGWILIDSIDPQKKFVPGKNQVQPASVDLTIGIIFRKEKRLSENSSSESVIQYDKPGMVVELAPGEIVTILTNEMIRLPKNVTGTLFPPNSLSVEGVLILNPGHVDPGYYGRVTVRLINFKEANLPLIIGGNIFTMTLEKLTERKDDNSEYMLEEYAGNMTDERFISWMRDKVQVNMGKAVFDVDATKLTKDLTEQYVHQKDISKLFDQYAIKLFFKSIAGILASVAAVTTIIALIEKLPEIKIILRVLQASSSH